MTQRLTLLLELLRDFLLLGLHLLGQSNNAAHKFLLTTMGHLIETLVQLSSDL